MAYMYYFIHKSDCIVVILWLCSKSEEFGSMVCQPPKPDSLEALRQLRNRVRENGDECLALLLSGVEMYALIGREWELLEVMRTFAHEADDMVRNTPTAAELKQLYERQD
jgi:hypothetical protein